MTSNVMTGPRALRLVGDDQRWRLLQQLAKTDLRVGELVERLGSTQNLVSYHLAQLRRAGLVSSRRSSADGRDAYYRFEADRCAELLSAAGAAITPALRLETSRDRPTWSGRHRPRVLFLCTGNSTRSQMAEALLEHLSGGAARARSAGSHPKPLHPNAVRVMAERGVDLSGRTSKHLDRFARTSFDRVITLCDKVREICPEFPGQPETIHWSIPDPAAVTSEGEASYPAFQETAAELETRVGFLLAALTNRADPATTTAQEQP